ncbi:heparan-alpha-glucosaminide N-acetyltransferase [Marinomonas pollencensis]|uniref:Putative membrane protein n=1 Tax=Marinomonas pollencensis TaxID=491954 RepID=A0A3E0DNB0_9GAMM|nr:heparan-alpha-glucosaminide N-acetyltransferase [Marinomonas pollencensis]REG84327.1 putative membrane protein [Marinomonas pollencensis]
MSAHSDALTVSRSLFLDAYRGLAVLLMMIFHFCWDLGNFGFISFSFSDPFWVDFRRLIVTLFLTAVGWSTYLSNRRSLRLVIWQRDIKVLLAATLISLGTYLALPDHWIFFGILHFIFLATFLVRPLSRYPIISSLIGSAILVIHSETTWLHFPNLFPSIVHQLNLPHQTLDILFPLPWIGVVLIGPLLGYLNWHQCPLPNHFLSRLLSIMGRFALPIYLVHQVILFALVAFTKIVLSS